MPKKKLLSVVIPIYNVERYVEKCLKSVSNQSYKNIEIICVDDGSTDNSGKIVDKIAKCDSRVRVIHQNNAGLVAARKVGANNANGEYIACVDGDDWIESDYFEKFMIHTNNGDVDCIWSTSFKIEYGGCCVINNTVKDMTQLEIESAVYGQNGSVNLISLAMWAKVIKRQLYCAIQNSMSNDISQQEDVSFSTRLLVHTPRIKFINNTGYHYIKRNDSMTRGNTGVKEGSDEILYLDTMKYLIDNSADLQLVRKTQINYTRVKMLHDFSSIQNKIMNIYLFPFDGIEKNQRIIVFGAGAVGKKIVKYILAETNLKIVAWVDSNKCGERYEVFYIENPEIINELEFDKIIIANTFESDCKEIKDRLIADGVPNEKIVTSNYDLMQEYAERWYLENSRDSKDAMMNNE